MSTLLENAIKRSLNDDPLRMYDDTPFKVLWRMSHGSRNKAIAIVKDMLPHYTKYVELVDDPDFGFCFDNALADMFGDGCEIEWNEE